MLAHGESQVETHSWKLPGGQPEMHCLRASPEHPQVQEASGFVVVEAHGESQILMHSTYLSTGQALIQDFKSSPEHPQEHVSDGDGIVVVVVVVGGVVGVGVGGGLGGADTEPLVTYASSRMPLTEAFNQHS